jgi:hypothetical protein
VKVPSALGEQTQAGVVFYFPPDLSVGEREGHIVLDRLAAQEEVIAFRMTILFDARQVPLNTLHSRVREYITRYLDYLDLAFDQENSR